MKRPVKQALFWTPRLMGLLFIAFISFFALDVFGENYSPWVIVLALLIHLFPSFFLLVALILGWRWEWAGALLFAGFGVWYLVATPGLDWAVYLILAGVPMLVGVLFLVGWIYRKQIRE